LFIRWATRAADAQSDTQQDSVNFDVSKATESTDAPVAREPDDVQPDSLEYDLFELDTMSVVREVRDGHLNEVKNRWNPDIGADASPEGRPAPVINSVPWEKSFSGDNT
jgi:hypothetical protein